MYATAVESLATTAVGLLSQLEYKDRSDTARGPGSTCGPEGPSWPLEPGNPEGPKAPLSP